MDFKEKRYAKKMARLFFTLGFVVMIAWALTMVGGIIRAFTMTEENKMSGTLMFIIGVTPMVMSLTLGFVGQRFLNKRIYYKQAIAEYRQRVFFTKSIRLLMEGDKKSVNMAIDTYNLINDDTPFRRFLFAFILASSYYSGDPERIVKGENRLKSILDTYDPEKINFRK